LVKFGEAFYFFIHTSFGPKNTFPSKFSNFILIFNRNEFFLAKKDYFYLVKSRHLFWNGAIWPHSAKKKGWFRPLFWSDITFNRLRRGYLFFSSSIIHPLHRNPITLLNETDVNLFSWVKLETTIKPSCLMPYCHLLLAHHAHKKIYFRGCQMFFDLVVCFGRVLVPPNAWLIS